MTNDTEAPLFGVCEVCGAPRTSAIVATPDGPQRHAVGLQCSAAPEHGPDPDPTETSPGGGMIGRMTDPYRGTSHPEFPPVRIRRVEWAHSGTATLTVTDFLLARIAEDEAEARRTRIIQVRATPSRIPHIVRWDPARVLAECEAKRKVVLLAEAAADGPPVHVDAWTAMKMALRYLAVVYADHPDYRQEWRP